MSPSPLLSRPDAGNRAVKSGALFLALLFFCVAEPVDRLLCPFRWLTGLLCPLCGMTRGLCAVGHGQLRQALQLNLLSPLIFVLFVGAFLANLLRLFGILPVQPALSSSRAFALLLAVLVSYWVLRLLSLVP